MHIPMDLVPALNHYHLNVNESRSSLTCGDFVEGTAHLGRFG